MHIKLHYTPMMLLGVLLLTGCGGGGSTPPSQEEQTTASAVESPLSPTDENEEEQTSSSNEKITLEGDATYDFVPGTKVEENSNFKLDFANTTQKPMRGVAVSLLDCQTMQVLQETTTDYSGHYQFPSTLPADSNVTIRIVASLPKWDVKVVDNTDDDALYAIQSRCHQANEINHILLNAPSGWSEPEKAYTSTRTAAPYAILDTIYSAIQTVEEADDSANFAPLQVNWSPQNTASFGDIDKGEIGTTYYQDNNLYILGDAKGDTDEYDAHVIAHEWAHYYENHFSRTDSIGGLHGEANPYLDIRVAFSEGWGNAFSAMALQDPVYFDTFINEESSSDNDEPAFLGWSMNIENDPHEDPGWFSESSVQRILYDIWDSHNNSENNDTLSLGFGPIHHVLSGPQKTTEAFTSLFSFITYLKEEKADLSDEIDTLLKSENIAPINDIYGQGRTNNAAYYPYHMLTLDQTTTLSTYTTYGVNNSLGNHQYLRFHIDDTSTYTINIVQIDGDYSDPDFLLFMTKPSYQFITIEDSDDGPSQTKQLSLQEGTYLIDMYNAATLAADFNVTLTQN